MGTIEMTMRLAGRRLAVALGALAVLATPAAADVRAGVEAWDRGDYKAAVEAWRTLAVGGDADAQFNMGQAYKLGRGVPVDIAMAEEWYRKAALQGHVQAEDNYGLALFQTGKRGQALSWLEKSAARGEPRAQYILGTMVFNGDAVKKDWVRAYALMTRAAAARLPQAEATLGQMDRYIAAEDRQKGTQLAHTYEGEANRAPLPTGDTPRQVVRERDEPRPPAPKAAPAKVAAAPAKPKPVPAPVAGGGWRVQLGAFREAGAAQRLWSQLAGRFAGRQPAYAKAGSLTRLTVGSFASQAEAARACAGITPCVPTRG